MPLCVCNFSCRIGNEIQFHSYPVNILLKFTCYHIWELGHSILGEGSVLIIIRCFIVIVALRYLASIFVYIFRISLCKTHLL